MLIFHYAILLTRSKTHKMTMTYQNITHQ